MNPDNLQLNNSVVSVFNLNLIVIFYQEKFLRISFLFYLHAAIMWLEI